jgi:hypothetical protein
MCCHVRAIENYYRDIECFRVTCLLNNSGGYILLLREKPRAAHPWLTPRSDKGQLKGCLMRRLEAVASFAKTASPPILVT